MEVGRINELTALTPSEVYWVKEAMQRRGNGESLGQSTLRKAEGRVLTCVAENAVGDVCGVGATHYTRANELLQTYCSEHWNSEIDPSNTMGVAGSTTGTPAVQVTPSDVDKIRALARECHPGEGPGPNPARRQQILEELLGIALHIDGAPEG